MLDIKLIRKQPDLVRAAIRDKGITLDLDDVLRADAEHRRLQYELEGLQRRRNENADIIKSVAADERAALIQRGRDIGASIDRLKPELASAETHLRELLLRVPQIPVADAPRATAEDNVEVRR